MCGSQEAARHAMQMAAAATGSIEREVSFQRMTIKLVNDSVVYFDWAGRNPDHYRGRRFNNIASDR
jgi:hypothetical protein